jgi:hypothetical protein
MRMADELGGRFACTAFPIGCGMAASVGYVDQQAGPELIFNTDLMVAYISHVSGAAHYIAHSGADVR